MSVHENHESWKSHRKEKEMGKRIRINGKLYESVSPRNRSRRLNEAKWHEAKKPYYYSIGDFEDLPDGSAARTADFTVRRDIEATLGGIEDNEVSINISMIDDHGFTYGFHKEYKARDLDKAEREFDEILDELDGGTLLRSVGLSHHMDEYY